MGSVTDIFTSFVTLFEDLVNTGSLAADGGLALGSSAVDNVLATGSAAADTVFGNITGSIIGE